jgi:hypothetical protein
MYVWDMANEAWEFPTPKVKDDVISPLELRVEHGAISSQLCRAFELHLSGTKVNGVREGAQR